MQQRVRDGALGEVVDPLPAAALGAHHLAVSSSHSTAIFVSDQSHHSPPFFAPPSSVAVSGPSARSLSRRPVAGAVRRSSSRASGGRGRGRRGGGRRSAATPRWAGCRRRATSTRRLWLPVQYADSTAFRPTAPSRAYGTSSCERASTEMVSSWTAPRWRSTPRTPPGGPARPGGPGRAGRCGGPRRRRARHRARSRHAADDRRRH